MNLKKSLALCCNSSSLHRAQWRSVCHCQDMVMVCLGRVRRCIQGKDTHQLLLEYSQDLLKSISGRSDLKKYFKNVNALCWWGLVLSSTSKAMKYNIENQVMSSQISFIYPNTTSTVIHLPQGALYSTVQQDIGANFKQMKLFL